MLGNAQLLLTSCLTLLSAVNGKVGINMLPTNLLYHLHTCFSVTVIPKYVFNLVNSPQLVLHFAIIYRTLQPLPWE